MTRRIDILLCTFRRPGVAETLASLDALNVPPGTEIRTIVADNDDTPSGQAVVEGFAATARHPVLYRHAPARNISIARNACLEAATAEWVAFLDDDEVADPAWLAELLAAVEGEDPAPDAVFGPAEAVYGAAAPDWMRTQDHHSNRPERRGDRVETGHTCNALLRWAGTPWQGARFDLARGTTGGEDTEFFFRLGRLGARFTIAERAIVREPVVPARLTRRWLMRRKYRMGQSYAASATGPAARARLALSAAAKVVACTLGMAANAFSEGGRNFWLLRAALHTGVVSGCLNLPQLRLYGSPEAR